MLKFTQGLDIGQSPFFIPKHHTSSIPKDILSPEEVQNLFKMQDNSIDGIRNKALLALLYGCGLRKGEAHRLDIGDINMAKDVIRIQKSKTSRQRDVPMSPSVKQHLEAYLYTARELLITSPGKETALLLSNRGTRLSLSAIQKKIEVIAQNSGIKKPITAHRLRHAIATHLVDHLSMEEIALFLGHQNIDSTQIYMHIHHSES